MIPDRQLTVARLMIALLFVGLALAWLKEPSQLLAGFAFTATLAVLACATFSARFGTVESRPTAWGFAAAGWGYLALSLSPPCYIPIRPLLATTMGLDLLYAIAFNSGPMQGTPGENVIIYDHESPGPGGMGFAVIGMWTARSPHYGSFLILGHAILTPLVGMAGARLADHLRRRSSALDGASDAGPRGTP